MTSYFIHWTGWTGKKSVMCVDEFLLMNLDLIFINEPGCWIDQDPKRT